jgi:hypothetical protein
VITLYRAAEDDFVTSGNSFTTEEDTAKAYRDNPGFGGSNLYKVEIEVNDVADLYDSDDPFEALSEVLGEPIYPAEYQHHFGRVIPDSQEIQDALAAKGYQWVQFKDDFPEGATTLMPIGSDTADRLESEITEQDDN